MFHFSEVVPDEVVNQLLEESKHPIYELEILPVLVAAVVWGECFRNAQVVCYVDNEGAKSSLLKGTGATKCVGAFEPGRRPKQRSLPKPGRTGQPENTVCVE